jgi:transposase-like protein
MLKSRRFYPSFRSEWNRIASIVYTDTFRSYDALDVSEFHHSRINDSKLFADQKNHINGIENFWNQTKRHMRRLNGIKQENFYWFSQGVRIAFQWRQPQKASQTV